MSAGAAENWLFDLGNSRVKVARLVYGAPVDMLALDWDRPDFAAALHDSLHAWPRADRAWVASVASAARAARVREVLAMFAPLRVEWLRTPREAAGVTNRYARPERLGIDRFLAMLAARARTPGAACVVVGCGTALTLDALAADGTHTEGLIALSPTGMLQALDGATAIADTNPDAFKAQTVDDTAAALQAGCWAAAGALVEWFAARAQTRLDAQRIWLHGGWAGRLAEWLAHDGTHVGILEHAVLRGLAVWTAQLCEHP